MKIEIRGCLELQRGQVVTRNKGNIEHTKTGIYGIVKYSIK